MLLVYNELFLKVDLTAKRGKQTFSTSDHLYKNKSTSSLSGMTATERKLKSMSYLTLLDNDLGLSTEALEDAEVFDEGEVAEEEVKQSPNFTVKSILPIMDQDEFIKFWGLVNSLFRDVEYESEMQDASINISTNLFKLGELARKLQVSGNAAKSSDNADQSVGSTSQASIQDIAWCITFEQIVASILNDNLFNQYFDAKYDLDAKLAEYKTQHA
jgi:hypothetical protein